MWRLLYHVDVAAVPENFSSPVVPLDLHRHRAVSEDAVHQVALAALVGPGNERHPLDVLPLLEHLRPAVEACHADGVDASVRRCEEPLGRPAVHVLHGASDLVPLRAIEPLSAEVCDDSPEVHVLGHLLDRVCPRRARADENVETRIVVADPGRQHSHRVRIEPAPHAFKRAPSLAPLRVHTERDWSLDLDTPAVVFVRPLTPTLVLKLCPTRCDATRDEIEHVVADHALGARPLADPRATNEQPLIDLR